jgi:uncharacterized protein involved in outer membrane biogenesis
MPRLILILLATPVFLVVAAILLIPLLLDEQKLLEMAASTLKEETGATLTVDGEINLALFPSIAIDLGDVAITMPGEQDVSVMARSLSVGVELRPLFSGSMEIGTIAVDGLLVSLQSAPEPETLDSNALTDEQLDAFYAQRRRAMEEAGSGQEAVIALPLALNVQRLTVTDSVLEIVSVETGEKSRLEIIELEATDLNLDDRAIPLSLQARLQGGESSVPVDVALQGRVKVNTASQAVTVETLSVEVSGVLNEPVSLQAQGVVDLMKQAADLEIELVIGATKGEGKLRYASFETPQIDANLHLNQFDPALIVLAGPIDQANFSGHIVKNMLLKLRVVDGIVRLNALTGMLHGGKLDMKATFNGQHNTAKLNTRGSLVGMDIAQALEAVESEPIVTGKTDLKWQLNSSGSTSKQLIEAMSGPIDMVTSEVILQSLGIEKMLCEAVALVNRESLTETLSDNSQFEDFKATFTARLSPSLAELDPACRVNDRLTAIGWPVDCKGSVSGDPARWCSVDSQKIIEDMATREVQRKVEKEAGKYLDKLFKR